jgi:hypothetical protein
VALLSYLVTVVNNVAHNNSESLVVAAFHTHSHQAVEMNSICPHKTALKICAYNSITNLTANIDVHSSIGNSVITEAHTAIITSLNNPATNNPCIWCDEHPKM